MENKINIGCNGLVIKDNRLLLGIRKNCFGAGTYGISGGHLEYGEKLIDGVKRELREELGIDATELELSSIIDQTRQNQHYIQVNFVVKNFSGEIQCLEPDKCEGWNWFDLEELPENIFPPHQEIVQSYVKKEFYRY